MSVYTPLNQADIEQLLAGYSLGHYVSHQGISAGVENTNYFVSTDSQELVLTLFEKHSPEELPFFLKLGEHLHQHGCKVPQPFRDNDGEFLQQIKGKPAVFVERARGGHVSDTAQHITEIAAAMAEVHNATAEFTLSQAHSHGRAWIETQSAELMLSLAAEDQTLLQQVLTLLAQCPGDLPAGIIHADLFHDNALFAEGHLSAIIDWYFAGYDCYILDIAIAMNDWCLDSAAKLNLARCEEFISAYQQHRPLSEIELATLPLMQIQAATRFWLSRHLAKLEHQASCDNITVKDPEQMKQLLIQLLSLAA